jgi:hypothetical protein
VLTLRGVAFPAARGLSMMLQAAVVAWVLQS